MKYGKYDRTESPQSDAEFLADEGDESKRYRPEDILYAGSANLLARKYKIEDGEILEVGDYEQAIFEEQLIAVGSGEVKVTGTGMVVIRGQG